MGHRSRSIPTGRDSARVPRYNPRNDQRIHDLLFYRLSGAFGGGLGAHGLNTSPSTFPSRQTPGGFFVAVWAGQQRTETT